MKRPPSNAGVGASSILLIIVVLCLTLFGVLSYVTARNDMALTGRTQQSVQDFYTADAAAQRALMAVDEWIQNGMTGEPAGVELTREGDALSFAVTAGDTHALRVTLRLSGGGYTIESYRYENIAEWTADDTINLFG